MKKFILEAMYFFDLFGSSVNILYKKKEQYHTLTGSLISLAIIAFTTLSFGNMLTDLFDRQSPNIVSTVEFTPDPPVFNLTNKNFFIGIGVSDDKGTPLQNTDLINYFIPTTYFCSQTTSLTEGIKIVCVTYTMEKCKKTQMKEEFIQELQLNAKELEYLYCVNNSQWEENPMSIQGVVQSSVWNYVAVILKLCDPQTQQCASQEEIESKMTNGYLTIVLADRLLDQKKPGNPYQMIKKTIITSYSRLIQKYLQVYMRHSITETTENFFYYSSNTFKQHVLQFQDRVESQATLNPQTNQFAVMNIFLDEKSITYYRTYDNILNILGSIGGLFDTLAFICGIFILPLTKFSQNIQLNKEQISQSKVLPRIDLLSDDSQFKRKQSIVHALKCLNTQQDPNFYNNSESIHPGKQAKLLKSFLTQKEKKLQLGGLEKITVFCSGPKKEQLDYGLDKIKQKLDINYIIWKLIEIDKLKMLIMDEHQQKLFDYIPKPVIPYRNQKIQNDGLSFYFQDGKTFELRVKEALESYKQSRKKPDQMNFKLINLMDQEIKQFFDQVISKNLKKKKINFRQRIIIESGKIRK